MTQFKRKEGVRRMTKEYYARKIFDFIKDKRFLKKNDESLSFIEVIEILDKVKSLLYKEKVILNPSRASKLSE